MILSKKDLREYLRLDYNVIGMRHPFYARITFGENWMIWRYIYVLRHLEYYKNKKRLFFDYLPYVYYYICHRYKSYKLGMTISPNSCGPGVHIVHTGFRRIDSFVHAGVNLTCLPMVLFGKARPGIDCEIIVGDNCYISTGVTILGPITIGNNVTIAAGAVVLDNVPDNCVVAGVPARIVKYK